MKRIFSSTVWEKAMRIVVIVGFICMMIAFGWNNLRDPNFWLDEAWQLESASGIALDAPLLTPPGSFLDAVRQNQVHNGDPGGFTYILHYWMKISTESWWLRMLPYIFFLCSVYFTVKLSRFFIPSKNIQVFLLFFLFIFGFAFRYSTMLRPYSMELCGIAMSLYYCLTLFEHYSKRKQWMLGFIGTFFLTSRYSFVLAYSAILITILILRHKGSVFSFLRQEYGLYLPVLFMGILIYSSALQYQITVPFTGHEPFLLHYQSIWGVLRIVAVNFFSFLALPTTIYLIISCIRYWMLHFLPGWKTSVEISVRRKKFSEKTHIKLIDPFFILFLWLIFLEIFFAANSWLGYVPWYITERWSLGIQYASVVALIGCIGCIYEYLERRFSKNIGIPYIVPILIIYGALLTMTGLRQGDLRDSTYSNLKQRVNQLQMEQYFVNYHSHAMIRYLFEFGPFQKVSRKIYPSHFRFETKEEHDANTAIDTTDIDIVLISHDIPEKFVKRFSDEFLDISEYRPSYMLKKVIR